MAVKIVYETHSLTTDNAAGVATGWLPGRLSEQGRHLARELGRRRRADGISAVFVSDLRRAVETAEIAFDGSGIPVYQDSRLRECNYGDLNGMPVAQLVAIRSQHVDEPYPGGQSYREVVNGMRDFLRDLAADWEGQRVVVISHSANQWVLDCLLGGRDLGELVAAPPRWREGWLYVLPTGWPDGDG
jgi:alpha-ribazole phosphatase/probable phosphoglycerate mutase